MSNFFASKSDRDLKTDRDLKPASEPQRAEFAPAPRPAAKTQSDTVSTVGHGMQITGNIVCDGTLHIYGKVVGDIHASELLIGEGARVEGKVIAPEAVVRGAFSGTIHGNAVKLQKTAVVDGEIYNRSLAIDLEARFEGVARRLDQAVAGPSDVKAMAINSVPLQPKPVNDVFANGHAAPGVVPLVQ